MSVLSKAGVPAVTVRPGTSVMRAVELMQEKEVDTLFVVENDVLLGAFTQRDLAFRVVLGKRDPEKIDVRDVMTSPAITLTSNATVADALRLMAAHRISQLPVMDQGLIKGMITLRDVFHDQTIDLNEELDSLVAYHTADGIGG
jgi:CBS domain-containing protein